MHAREFDDHLALNTAIELRLSEWTLTAVHNGEGLQVLRYRKDQKYDAVRSGC